MIKRIFHPFFFWSGIHFHFYNFRTEIDINDTLLLKKPKKKKKQLNNNRVISKDCLTAYVNLPEGMVENASNFP